MILFVQAHVQPQHSLSYLPPFPSSTERWTVLRMLEARKRAQGQLNASSSRGVYYLYLYLAGGAESRSAVVGGGHSEGVVSSFQPPKGRSGSQFTGSRVEGEALSSRSCTGQI